MPGPAADSMGPVRDSRSKWGLRKRVRRASWMVWIVEFEPEPWKARMVGRGILYRWEGGFCGSGGWWGEGVGLGMG